MINHTSVESREQPDYFYNKHAWSRAAKAVPMPAKGRKAGLGQVSSDAPASFLINFVQPSSPTMRKSVFHSPKSADKAVRLIQELRVSRYNDFTRFSYEDYNISREKTVDYASLPMSVVADLQKGTSEGAKAKLPYYSAHAAAVKEGKFAVKQGMFSYKARQKVVGRADGTLLKALRSVSTARNGLRKSVQEIPARDHSVDAPNSASISHDLNYFAVYSSRMALPNSKAVRALLSSSCNRRRPPQRSSSHADFEYSNAIDSFEQQRKADIGVFHPVTKKRLGL